MINGHKSLAHLPPLEQARKALRHVLQRIHEHETIGWYMGCGTESFALATEALAAIEGSDLTKLRALFAPTKVRDPRDELRDALHAHPKLLPLTSEEAKTLRKIVAYHEEMQDSLTRAANAATGQTGFGLHVQAEAHGGYSDELQAIMSRTEVVE